MTKLLVIITCIVVLTVHWESFKDIVNMDKMVDITAIVLEKVKE
tara:strand:- start:179 stop:310 length:132 start_codon:yes stop_codon:yes gene_type:complete